MIAGCQQKQLCLSVLTDSTDSTGPRSVTTTASVAFKVGGVGANNNLKRRISR
jgi:hypothetical protein